MSARDLPAAVAAALAAGREGESATGRLAELLDGLLDDGAADLEEVEDVALGLLEAMPAWLARAVAERFVEVAA